MKHRRTLGDEWLRMHVTLVTLVFLVIMVGLGALAWITKGGKYMPPPSPNSLAAPIPNAPPPPSK